MNHHHHRHSVTTTGTTPAHRVTRRKSMSNGANLAAVAAHAVKEGTTTADMPFPSLSTLQPAGPHHARSTPKPAPVHDAGSGLGIPGYPSPPSSLPTTGPLGTAVGMLGGPPPAPPAHPVFAKPENLSTEKSTSAIADGNAADVVRPPRNRRASEGTRADQAATPGSGSGVGKSSRTRSGSELKCEKCGKGYKHSSCLTKHLWEHTPEWSYTSKLLISKHQQVQLLEAASILVAMNPTTPPASSSGASNNDGNSSANESSASSDDTTPPPPTIGMSSPTPRGIRTNSSKAGKRYSSGTYSRSANSSMLAGTSAPSTAAATFPNHLQRPPARPRTGSFARGSVGASPSLRPVPSAEDDALAAAVELLSCSFHTTPSAHAIPRGALADLGSPPAGGRSYVGPLNDVVEMKREEEDDIDMEDLGGPRRREDDEDEGWARRGKSEEDEDGVFGRMEE